MSTPAAPTEAEVKRANAWLKDGAIVLTAIACAPGALLMVRGKDHDLSPEECRELAAALLAAADLRAS